MDHMASVAAHTLDLAAAVDMDLGAVDMVNLDSRLVIVVHSVLDHRPPVGQMHSVWSNGLFRLGCLVYRANLTKTTIKII